MENHNLKKTSKAATRQGRLNVEERSLLWTIDFTDLLQIVVWFLMCLDFVPQCAVLPHLPNHAIEMYFF